LDKIGCYGNWLKVGAPFFEVQMRFYALFEHGKKRRECFCLAKCGEIKRLVGHGNTKLEKAFREHSETT
jgi:hypothetical protein